MVFLFHMSLYIHGISCCGPRTCVYNVSILSGAVIQYVYTVASVLTTGIVSVSSTTITITGSVPSDTVVTGFEVRWQRDTSVGCSDEDEDTISETGAFPNIYQISGLEPGNRYTIELTVFNASGSASVSNSLTATTLETGENKFYIHVL